VILYRALNQTDKLPGLDPARSKLKAGRQLTNGIMAELATRPFQPYRPMLQRLVLMRRQ